MEANMLFNWILKRKQVIINLIYKIYTIILNFEED